MGLLSAEWTTGMLWLWSKLGQKDRPQVGTHVCPEQAVMCSNMLQSLVWLFAWPCLEACIHACLCQAPPLPYRFRSSAYRIPQLQQC